MAVRVATATAAVMVAFLVLGPGGARSGLLPPMVGFGLFGLGGVFALLTFLAGCVGLWSTRGGKRPGRARVALATGSALLVLATGGALMRKGRQVPRINDITTDFDSPPTFVQATAADENAGRDLSYPGEFRAQQEAAYPHLKPVEVLGDVKTALDRVEAVARSQRLDVVARDDSRGALEANQTSTWFRFTDDVVVRAWKQPSGMVRIDARSKSRHGKSDFGVNAARLTRLLQELEK